MGTDQNRYGWEEPPDWIDPVYREERKGSGQNGISKAQGCDKTLDKAPTCNEDSDSPRLSWGDRCEEEEEMRRSLLEEEEQTGPQDTRHESIKVQKYKQNSGREHNPNRESNRKRLGETGQQNSGEGKPKLMGGKTPQEPKWVTRAPQQTRTTGIGGARNTGSTPQGTEGDPMQQETPRMNPNRNQSRGEENHWEDRRRHLPSWTGPGGRYMRQWQQGPPLSQPTYAPNPQCSDREPPQGRPQPRRPEGPEEGPDPSPRRRGEHARPKEALSGGTRDRTWVEVLQGRPAEGRDPGPASYSTKEAGACHRTNHGIGASPGTGDLRWCQPGDEASRPIGGCRPHGRGAPHPASSGTDRRVGGSPRGTGGPNPGVARTAEGTPAQEDHPKDGVPTTGRPGGPDLSGWTLEDLVELARCSGLPETGTLADLAEAVRETDGRAREAQVSPREAPWQEVRHRRPQNARTGRREDSASTPSARDAPGPTGCRGKKSTPSRPMAASSRNGSMRSEPRGRRKGPPSPSRQGNRSAKGYGRTSWGSPEVNSEGGSNCESPWERRPEASGRRQSAQGSQTDSPGPGRQGRRSTRTQPSGPERATHGSRNSRPPSPPRSRRRDPTQEEGLETDRGESLPEEGRGDKPLWGGRPRMGGARDSPPHRGQGNPPNREMMEGWPGTWPQPPGRETMEGRGGTSPHPPSREAMEGRGGTSPHPPSRETMEGRGGTSPHPPSRETVEGRPGIWMRPPSPETMRGRPKTAGAQPAQGGGDAGPAPAQPGGDARAAGGGAGAVYWRAGGGDDGGAPMEYKGTGDEPTVQSELSRTLVLKLHHIRERTLTKARRLLASTGESPVRIKEEIIRGLEEGDGGNPLRDTPEAAQLREVLSWMCGGSSDKGVALDLRGTVESFRWLAFEKKWENAEPLSTAAEVAHDILLQRVRDLCHEEEDPLHMRYLLREMLVPHARDNEALKEKWRVAPPGAQKKEGRNVGKFGACLGLLFEVCRTVTCAQGRDEFFWDGGSAHPQCGEWKQKPLVGISGVLFSERRANVALWFHTMGASSSSKGSSTKKRKGDGSTKKPKKSKRSKGSDAGGDATPPEPADADAK